MMTRLKFRQFVLGAGAATALVLSVPAADIPTLPAKPGVTLPKPGQSATKSKWVPMFDYDALDVKPRPLVQAPPVYPPALKAAGAKAKVAVEFIIGKEGNVEAAQILSSTDPRFNDVCVAAAMKWRFTVPKKRGDPVYCRVSQNLAFE